MQPASIAAVDVVVTCLRDQAFGLGLFHVVRIDPTDKRLIVVESANHFRAAFDRIAGDVFYVDAGGALPSDPRDIPYAKYDRRAYPWVDDAFSV